MKKILDIIDKDIEPPLTFLYLIQAADKLPIYI